MFLWKTIAVDLAMDCHVSATLDYKKLESRVEHEGLSFLTITLPQLSVALESGLDSGVWDPSLVACFKHRGGLPLFLGGFLDRVFDRGTGRLLTNPCVDSIFAIRQLSLMFKKILVPCSDARERDAIAGFVECEHEVAEWTWQDDSQKERFARVSALLFSDVLSEVDMEVYNGELVGKHGPGATADKLRGNQKYRQLEWPSRLDDVFEYIEYALPSLRYVLEADRVRFIEPEHERPSRVVSVPKTLKTPRIIAIEPTCMQFMQQAVKNAMVQKLESSRVGRNTRRNLACGFVGFTRQDPNRVMAAKGSRDGDLATLDMSEASDRVSNQHVLLLTARWPSLSKAIQATRSRKADVPGWGIIPLSKFASMGSALTFPLEAMVFTTAVFMGVEQALSRQLSRKDVLSLLGQVRVYGDDIIVPVQYVEFVISELTALGLKVNSKKSFWNGKFRESCGGDYYDGHWVTPVYVRRMFPASRTDVSGVESLVSLRNQLYKAGLWKATRYLDSVIAGVLPHFPIVEESSTLLGRTSYLPYQAEKMSRHTHSPLVRGYVSVYRTPSSHLDGFDALFKCLSRPHAERRWFDLLFPEGTDDKHLERSGRPRAVGIKLAWKTPY